jgi:hypothetical protein
LNYFFRIDVLYYDFIDKGVKYCIENVEAFKEVMKGLQMFKDIDKVKESIKE